MGLYNQPVDVDQIPSTNLLHSNWEVTEYLGTLSPQDQAHTTTSGEESTMGGHDGLNEGLLQPLKRRITLLANLSHCQVVFPSKLGPISSVAPWHQFLEASR
ncbi:hypothetical protein PGTUg99_007265, partial [Puccinia graminis f. sp. tritici]